MKKRIILLIAFLAAVPTLLAARQSAAPQSAGPEPRLVLLIVVDQFRYDYLTRFRSEYTSGFKRLLAEGAVFTDANLDHYPTVTAPGHATMLSGAYLSDSGIIGNDWFERGEGKQVTSVTDESVKPVGAPSGRSSSPKRLLVPTLADELRKASKAKKGAPDAPHIFGLSLKDRAAILPTGKAADAAYWFDTDNSGNFVTSTYYTQKPPDWLKTFNDRRLADKFAGKPWTLLDKPENVLGLMPATPGPPLFNGVYATPFGNELLLSFADYVMTEEKLGQRGVTDLVTVSFSSNDSVGHAYGPDAIQVRDISIKTDRIIGQLLDSVDKLVGLDHTIVAFTSDHGVASMPEARSTEPEPGGRMAQDELFGPIEQALAKQFGPGKWVIATAGSAPYLNYALITSKGLTEAQVRRVAEEAAKAVPHVAKVFTRDQLMQKKVSDDAIGRRVLHGFNASRSGDLEIILQPYWFRNQPTGSTHGTPYEYDAHIPLILMGPMIKAGEYKDPVVLNDLAPTLATIAHIGIPSKAAGRVLKEALK